MILPKKITPDCILEAVIELKYEATVPNEILLGLIFDSFDMTYYYTNLPLAVNQPSQSAKRTVLLPVKSNEHIIYNDKISIRLASNAIIFSCLNQYIGWDDFFPEIEKALHSIMKITYITKWTRVGLRYLTEYENKDLKDCTKFKYEFGLSEIMSNHILFRSEFNYNGSKIVLNLSNNLPVFKPTIDRNTMEMIAVSRIDIDVINSELKIKEVLELLPIIEDAHIKEKEIFFSIVNKEFLESLNPQY